MPMRTIVGLAVPVQVLVRPDVERQAAVGLHDEPQLIVVEERRLQPVAAERRRDDARHDERVRLVERRHALLAIEVRGIGHAVVAAADDVGAGQGRVVLAVRERVGRLRLPTVGHALVEGRGERVVGGLADRLEHVDVIERRINARRRTDRRRVDRTPVAQRLSGRNHVDVHQHRQIAANRVDVSDRDRHVVREGPARSARS